MSYKFSVFSIIFSSIFLLPSCDSKDFESTVPGVLSKAEEVTPPSDKALSEGLKAVIDPKTSELTSTLPASDAPDQTISKKSATTTTNTFTYEVNEHGHGVLVPDQPQVHELNACMDYDGNLITTHSQTTSLKPDCSESGSKQKGVSND